MLVYNPPRLTEVRQTIKDIEEKCDFLGKVVLFPLKANFLLCLTITECSLDVFNKVTSFLNGSDTESLLDRTVEKEVNEPIELNFANLNYDVHYQICDFLNYEDIISFASISKEFHENFKDRVYRINSNHHLYHIITNLKYSKKIERKLTQYKIASCIAPILNGIGSHLSFICLDALFLYNWNLAGFLFPVIHFFYTVDQIIKRDIKLSQSRGIDEEGLRLILSYPLHLNNDIILINYLIDDKVPLLPCKDAISGESFDFANIIIKKSNLNKDRIIFDFDAFKKIQCRINELKANGYYSHEILSFDANSLQQL